MNMFRAARRYGHVLALAGACLAVMSAPMKAAEMIHLVTESYPPMNYAENGVLKGVSVDLMRQVMQDAKLEHTIELMPWARAYALAESKKDYCVFTTVHNSERDAKFAWVEPLLTSYAYLIKKRGSDVKATTIDEARKYLIGTQRGDYTVGVLEAKHFDRIDLAPEINLTLNKLLAGRIDLMPMAAPLVAEEQKKGTEIEPLMVLVSDINGLACNRDTDPAALAAMRESLKKRIEDGTRQAIFAKYGFMEGLPK